MGCRNTMIDNDAYSHGLGSIPFIAFCRGYIMMLSYPPSNYTLVLKLFYFE